MRKLILIMGHLAAGKSTFASNLAEKLNALVLIKDDIKEILGDNIGFSNRQENLKLSFATFNVMKYVLEKSFQSNDILILESNFRISEIEVLNDIIKNKDIDVINFVLSAKPEILYKRYVVRNKFRHIVHTSVGLAEKDKFKNTLVDFDEYPLIGKIIHVDTSDFEKINIDEYLELLK